MPRGATYMGRLGPSASWGHRAVGALAGGRRVALVFSGTLSRVRVAGTVARQWGGPAAPELCPLSG